MKIRTKFDLITFVWLVQTCIAWILFMLMVMLFGHVGQWSDEILLLATKCYRFQILFTLGYTLWVIILPWSKDA